MKRARASVAALVCAAGLLSPRAHAAERVERVIGGVTFTATELRRLLSHSPLPPVPADETNRAADDPRAFELGWALFYEPRLSANGRVSCATCHDPQHSFADARPLAEGLSRGRRHTPALWNVGYARWLFWDGRSDTLWAQALQPIESPAEMGGSRLGALALAASDPFLSAAYARAFGEPPPSDLPPRGGPLALDARWAAAWERLPPERRAAADRAFANLGKALGAFQRRLVSRRAPFDVFVEGLRADDPQRLAVLSAPALRGAALFFGRGNCFVCHTGPLFSDGEFHDIGAPLAEGLTADAGRLAGLRLLAQAEFGALSEHSDDRQGARAELTRRQAAREELQGQVKTPSLRNVARTAPYMHQGQFASLDDVLAFYSTHAGRRGAPQQQERILVPLRLSATETADLRAFLEALTDESIDPLWRHPPERRAPLR